VPPGDVYCHEHELQVNKDYQRGRETTHGKLYTKRWDKARRMFLRENPLCVECRRKGRVTPANEVDHIIPHRGDLAMFWNTENWEAMCKPCHTAKTNSEDGGFGNKKREHGIEVR
jgi:5-methylcytosine-specific restriction protein A